MEKQSITELLCTAAIGHRLMEIIRKRYGLLREDSDHVMKNGVLVKLVITGKIEENTTREGAKKKEIVMDSPDTGCWKNKI